MCRFKNFLKKITEIKLIVPMRDILKKYFKKWNYTHPLSKSYNYNKPIASLLTQFSYLYLQITAS